MKISVVLDQIDLGSMALPEFQRGYVWNREQVRGLMLSLYRKYPIGSLLVWVTEAKSAQTRGDGAVAAGTVKLLLDGQQRMTTLYGIIRGKPPKFFDGKPETILGLHFNLDDESFEFYAPAKMRDNPLWIRVTEVIQAGSGAAIERMMDVPALKPNFSTYVNRLNALDAIKDVDLHIEEVAGPDKTVDTVVEIFNRVNSGGTKLSKGDLALARICAQWPEARDEMKSRLDRWTKAGFSFNLDWLLRNITTVQTGQAMFSGLKDIDTQTFRPAMAQAEKASDTLLNMIGGRLGLDHDRVLGGRYAFPVMTRYLKQAGGKLKDQAERDRLLYWYVHSFLWGRFTGSTETVLNRDLTLIEQYEGGLDRLIHELRRSRGDLRIRPDDFSSWSLGARFYPMLYLLTRVHGARDWGSGLPLRAELLGKLNALQVHHIFPRAVLYSAGYTRSEVNALANFCFLTQDSNLVISSRRPEEYFREVEVSYPGALASQWIPIDRDLWRLDRFGDFLAARQALLAAAANQFLDQLLHGELPEPEVSGDITTRAFEAPRMGVAPVGDEEDQILDCLAWVEEQRLPEPEVMYELLGEASTEPLAIIDIGWPRGLQPGLSQPVAVLLNEPPEVGRVVNEAGYRFFSSVEDFKRYVLAEVLAEPVVA